MCKQLLSTQVIGDLRGLVGASAYAPRYMYLHLLIQGQKQEETRFLRLRVPRLEFEGVWLDNRWPFLPNLEPQSPSVTDGESLDGMLVRDLVVCLFHHIRCCVSIDGREGSGSYRVSLAHLGFSATFRALCACTVNKLIALFSLQDGAVASHM